MVLLQESLGEVIRVLLDDSHLFNRKEWARVFGTTEEKIEEWISNKEIPRRDLLHMLVDMLPMTDGVPVRVVHLCEDILKVRFNDLIHGPFPAFTFLTKRVETFGDYITMPAFKRNFGDPVARVNRTRGHAVINEPDGRIFIVDIDESRELQNGKSVYVADFLGSNRDVIELVDAGPFPHKELIAYLELAYEQESCLTMILMAIDKHSESELKKFASEAAVGFLKNPGVSFWIIQVFKSIPLPKESTDIKGVPNDWLKNYLEKIN